MQYKEMWINVLLSLCEIEYTEAFSKNCSLSLSLSLS